MIAGTYTISYDVSDSSGNAANTVSRTIVVNAESESGSGFTNNNIESDSFTSTQEVLGGDNPLMQLNKHLLLRAQELNGLELWHIILVVLVGMKYG